MISLKDFNALGARAEMAYKGHLLLDMPIEPRTIHVEAKIVRQIMKAAKPRIGKELTPHIKSLKADMKGVKEADISPELLFKLMGAAMPVLFPESNPESRSSAPRR
jgi:hypothetical protein